VSEYSPQFVTMKGPANNLDYDDDDDDDDDAFRTL
jgi:hypothetical protein